MKNAFSTVDTNNNNGNSTITPSSSPTVHLLLSMRRVPYNIWWPMAFWHFMHDILFMSVSTFCFFSGEFTNTMGLHSRNRFVELPTLFRCFVSRKWYKSFFIDTRLLFLRKNDSMNSFVSWIKKYFFQYGKFDGWHIRWKAQSIRTYTSRSWFIFNLKWCAHNESFRLFMKVLIFNAAIFTAIELKLCSRW